MNWKRGTYKICVNERAISAGSDTGERKGIVNDLFGITGNRYGYTVTHLATGLICAQAKKQDVAKLKCEEFIKLPIDWASIDPLHDTTEDIRVSVRNIALDR